jgi:hypothetical protein
MFRGRPVSSRAVRIKAHDRARRAMIIPKNLKVTKRTLVDAILLRHGAGL